MVLANLKSLWNTEMLAPVLKAVRRCTARSSSWTQLTSISIHWLQKVAAGICYIHRGPSMNLLVRIASKFSSGFEVPDTSEPQDPRPHQSSQHDAIEQNNALDTQSRERYHRRLLCKMPTTWPFHTMVVFHVAP